MSAGECWVLYMHQKFLQHFIIISAINRSFTERFISNLPFFPIHKIDSFCHSALQLLASDLYRWCLNGKFQTLYSQMQNFNGVDPSLDLKLHWQNLERHWYSLWLDPLPKKEEWTPMMLFNWVDWKSTGW